jgi:hypothetical protein
MIAAGDLSGEAAGMPSVQREPRPRGERDRPELLLGPAKLLQETGVLLEADGPRPVSFERLAHLGGRVEGDLEVQRFRTGS